MLEVAFKRPERVGVPEGLRVPVPRGKDAHSSLTFVLGHLADRVALHQLRRGSQPVAFQRIRAFRYPSGITGNKSNSIERLMLPTRSPRSTPLPSRRNSTLSFGVAAALDDGHAGGITSNAI